VCVCHTNLNSAVQSLKARTLAALNSVIRSEDMEEVACQFIGSSEEALQAATTWDYEEPLPSVNQLLALPLTRYSLVIATNNSKDLEEEIYMSLVMQDWMDEDWIYLFCAESSASSKYVIAPKTARLHILMPLSYLKEIGVMYVVPEGNYFHHYFS